MPKLFEKILGFLFVIIILLVIVYFTYRDLTTGKMDLIDIR